RLRGIRRAPDRLQDYPVCKDFVRMCCEQLQEIPLRRRQMDKRSVDLDPSAFQVDLQVSQTNNRVRADSWFRRVAQRDAHAREQLVHAEGFGQIVVGAQIQCVDLVALRLARRQYDNRGAGARSYTLDDLQAVHIGQPEV